MLRLSIDQPASQTQSQKRGSISPALRHLRRLAKKIASLRGAAHLTRARAPGRLLRPPHRNFRPENRVQNHQNVEDDRGGCGLQCRMSRPGKEVVLERVAELCAPLPARAVLALSCYVITISKASAY